MAITCPRHFLPKQLQVMQSPEKSLHRPRYMQTHTFINKFMEFSNNKKVHGHLKISETSNQSEVGNLERSTEQ